MSLALVMVGLPARGKTYTARKIARYLSWRGYQAKVFNVGNYRRDQAGAQVPHEFFNPQNQQGMEARRKAAEAALDDMLNWFLSGGEVGIYDATNTTKTRRSWVLKRLESNGVTVAFVESICNDPKIINTNMQETKLYSPDYVGISAQQALHDFRARIEHYHSVYEPIGNEQLSWIKIIDAGRQVIVNRLDDYLLARIAMFVMNLHIVPHSFWFSRHGQSEYNLHDRVGGDPSLSASGKLYTQSLHHFFADKTLENIWTSTLRRTIETASLFKRPIRRLKALDEISAGICDGLSYEEIQQKHPHIAQARRADKLCYRYPQGESYEDVIERLEPVIFELERSRNATLVIGHQAVLRALYAYFANLPREDCPYLSVPLHTVIQLTPKTYGCTEMRFALPPQVD